MYLGNIYQHWISTLIFRFIYATRLVIEGNTCQNKILSFPPFSGTFIFSFPWDVQFIRNSFNHRPPFKTIFHRMLLQLSLRRSLGRPIGREPSASSPYNNRLRVLLSSIRETCPSHRKRLLCKQDFDVYNVILCEYFFISYKMKQRGSQWG